MKYILMLIVTLVINGCTTLQSKKDAVNSAKKECSEKTERLRLFRQVNPDGSLIELKQNK